MYIPTDDLSASFTTFSPVYHFLSNFCSTMVKQTKHVRTATMFYPHTTHSWPKTQVQQLNLVGGQKAKASKFHIRLARILISSPGAAVDTFSNIHYESWVSKFLWPRQLFDNLTGPVSQYKMYSFFQTLQWSPQLTVLSCMTFQWAVLNGVNGANFKLFSKTFLYHNHFLFQLLKNPESLTSHTLYNFVHMNSTFASVKFMKFTWVMDQD